MGGAASALVGGGVSPMLDTTFTTATSAPMTGYSDASGPAGALGSIADGTYDDRTATSRTIAYVLFQAVGPGLDLIHFALVGTGISDSNSTFWQINISGGLFTRLNASYSSDDGNGNTLWTFSSPSGSPMTGSPESLVVS